MAKGTFNGVQDACVHIDHVRNVNSHLFLKILPFVIPSRLFGLSKWGALGRPRCGLGGGEGCGEWRTAGDW